MNHRAATPESAPRSAPAPLPEAASAPTRRLSIGAELSPAGMHVRVWAPAVARVEVVITGSIHDPAADVRQEVQLAPEPDAYHSGVVPGARAGDLYMFRLDDQQLRPDPASRFQPGGPHGPSQVIDPFAYQWQTNEWPAPTSRPDVVYEMHMGTFSPDGRWSGAIARLPKLAELGVTILEVMPVAEFTVRSAGATTGCTCSRLIITTALRTTSGGSWTRRTTSA